MTTPKDVAVCANSIRPEQIAQLYVTRYTPFDELPQFLSVEEFRMLVGIGRSTTYDLLRRGELRHIRFGRVVRIPKEALRLYLWPSAKEGDER